MDQRVVVILILVGLLGYAFSKPVCPNKTAALKILARQAARWSLAASQDKSPLVALLHANYGAAYLWALKDIATEKEINRVLGMNVHAFKDKIIKIQDAATKQVTKACPDFTGETDKHLARIAGDA